MTPQEQERLRQVEDRLRALEQPNRALRNPFDPETMGALDQACIGHTFKALKANGFFLTPGFSADPSQAGQFTYDENGGTPRIRVKLGSAVKTITTS